MNLKRTLRFAIIKSLRVWNAKRSEFLRDLDYVLEPLKKFNKPENIQNRPNGTENETGSGYTIESKAHPRGIKENQTNNDRDYALEIWKFRVELFLLVVGIAAFGVYVFQGCEAKREAVAAEGQLHEMQEQRELDERAWIYAEVSDNSLNAVNSNCFVKIKIENIGKTSGLITGDFTQTTLDTNAIPPKDSVAAGMTYMLIPNKSVDTFATIDPRFLAELIFHGRPIYFYGTVYYQDISRSNHWVQFCYSLTDGGKNINRMLFHNTSDEWEAQTNN